MRPTLQAMSPFNPMSPSPLGLPHDDQSADAARPAAEADLPFSAIVAENKELQAEAQRLRAERERWLACQRSIMELLNSKSPDRIIHDLRNVLNERELFKTLAEIE